MDLTIIVTGYDEGPLLRRAVESVLNQTPQAGTRLPEREIVLVFDRGTESGTARVVADIRRAYPGVRVMENGHRKGVGGSRNTGIDAAEGDWVAFLDGDDEWFPDAIARRWDAVLHYDDAGWLAADFVRAPDLEQAPSGAAFTRDNADLRRLMGQPLEQDGGPFTDGSLLRLRRPVAEFCRASLCWTGTVMARRDLVREVGGFHERLVRGQDVHMWLRLAAASDFVFVPVPVALYRTRASTLNRRGTTFRAWDIVGTLDLMRRPLMRPWIRDLYRGRMIRMLNEQASYLRGQRRFLAAAGYAAASGLCWPVQARAWRYLAASLVRRA
jgi:glycosyltransferase involved in cell wall biosynthesis